MEEGFCVMAPCGRTIAQTGFWNLVRDGKRVRNWACAECSRQGEEVDDAGARLFMIWPMKQGQ